VIVQNERPVRISDFEICEMTAVWGGDFLRQIVLLG
jgi:hypothetical protein